LLSLPGCCDELGARNDEAALSPHHHENEYWDPSQVDPDSAKEPYVLNPTGDVRVAVLDFGAKANIVRALVRRRRGEEVR